MNIVFDISRVISESKKGRNKKRQPISLLPFSLVAEPFEKSNRFIHDFIEVVSFSEYWIDG